MECHKCEFNGKGDEKCIECVQSQPNPSLSNHGKVFVGYEELVGTQYEPRCEDTFFEDDTTSILDDEQARLLTEFLRKILYLKPKELTSLCEVWQGCSDNMTFAQIACKLNISKQDLKYHMGNLFVKIPVLKAVFPKVKQTLRSHQENVMAQKFSKEIDKPRQSYLPLG